MKSFHIRLEHQHGRRLLDRARRYECDLPLSSHVVSNICSEVQFVLILLLGLSNTLHLTLLTGWHAWLVHGYYIKASQLDTNVEDDVESKALHAHIVAALESHYLLSHSNVVCSCDINMQSYMIPSVMLSHKDVLQEMTGSLLYKTQILIGWKLLLHR